MCFISFCYRSGYALFSTEMLVKLNEVPSNERMSVISQKWKTMTEKEKLDYKKMKDKLGKQYTRELAKFKAVSINHKLEFL